MDEEFFTYAKTHYFAEFERRKELGSNITTSAGVASLIGAGIYALAFKAPVVSSGSGALCYVGLVYASITLAVAVYCLVRSHVGHAYRYTASIEGIVASRTRGEEQSLTAQQIASGTRLLIGEQYVESVATNERANDAKSGWLHRANKALVTSLAIVFAVGGLTVILHVTEQVNESRSHGPGPARGKQTGAPGTAGSFAGSSAIASH